MKHERWPGWVYDTGGEPAYASSLANERTFLAWIRTSLALMAGGVALDSVDTRLPEGLQRILAGLLVALGIISAVGAWVRWARGERAMRRDEPLRSLGFGAPFAVCLALVAVVLIILGI